MRSGRLLVTVGVIFALAVALSSAASAQQVPAVAGSGTAAVAGTVVSADGGRPVNRARVTLGGGTPRVTRSVLTDAQGRFSITALGPGEYTLTVSRAGYLDTVYGQKQPGSGRPGTPIRLDSGQQIGRLAVSLNRGGVITGLVRDESGEPAYGAQVRMFRWVMKSGERTLQPAGTGTADDRGVYRIPMLQPGEYVVSVQGRPDGEPTQMLINGTYEQVMIVYRMTGNEGSFLESRPTLSRSDDPTGSTAPSIGYAPIYYPGTLQMSAAASVAVSAGEEHGGVDLQLELVPMTRLTGVVSGADGAVGGAQVQLIDRAQLPGLGTRSARTSPDGRFSFSEVPPGQYQIVARASAKGAQQLEASGREASQTLAAATTEARAASIAAALASVAPLWAMADITTDGRDQPNVTLSLQPGLSISGRVAFEDGNGVPANLSRMTVGIVRAGQTPITGEGAVAPPAAVDAAGRFTIRGVMPGDYRVVPQAGVPAGFTIKSSVFEGRDTLDFPLVVTGGDLTGGVLTLTTKTAELGGVVQNSSGQPAPQVTVVIFAAEERFWTPQSRRIQAGRPAQDGRFSFKNLPPGHYRLVAVADPEPGQWFDPAFLRQAGGGSIAVTISEGEKRVQDLVVRQAPAAGSTR